MNIETLWESALGANYTTNKDLSFPYSELPYLGDYRLNQIPLSLNELIEHVDYWGEGRVVSLRGVSGFTHSYNINHQYRLVSDGADRDRKIPNRIPVSGYDNCDTSKYLKDNSVLTVTFQGENINTSCADDIARIVNKDFGKVIVYIVYISPDDISRLTAALKKKSIYLYRKYDLPEPLKQITSFVEYKAFLNVNVIKDEIIRLVGNGTYNEAVALIKDMNKEDCGFVVKKLLEKYLSQRSSDNSIFMSFGYQLWINGGEDVVRNNFPEHTYLVFEGVAQEIVNSRNVQLLKLDVNVDSDNDRRAWGNGGRVDYERLRWRFDPIWENNAVLFKLYNFHGDRYLKSGVAADSMGDRAMYGSTESNTNRHKFILEPFIEEGAVKFHIINYEYRQGLKLGVAVDSYGDRLLYGHNGDIRENNEGYKWIITRRLPSGFMGKEDRGEVGSARV